MEIIREANHKITEMLRRPAPVFQILIGPRQVGKTTAARQIFRGLGGRLTMRRQIKSLPGSRVD